MARNRSSAKKAGSSFERATADYLAAHYDDRIDRRRLTGSKDRGDITGLRHMGQRIVVECKNYGGRLMASTWLNEAEIERGNDSAGVGIVVAKRKGTTDPGEQIVMMTLANLVSLMTGTHPDEESA